MTVPAKHCQFAADRDVLISSARRALPNLTLTIRMTRYLIFFAFTLSPAALSAQQQEGFPPDFPDSWRVAGTAKIFCSAMFVSERDSAEAHAHLTSYFLGSRIDSITSIEIDRDRRLVRLTLADRITREAKQYGDQGCVIHQPGID